MHPIEQAVHIQRIDRLFIHALARVEVAKEQRRSTALN